MNYLFHMSIAIIISFACKLDPHSIAIAQKKKKINDLFLSTFATRLLAFDINNQHYYIFFFLLCLFVSIHGPSERNAMVKPHLWFINLFLGEMLFFESII